MQWSMHCELPCFMDARISDASRMTRASEAILRMHLRRDSKKNLCSACHPWRLDARPAATGRPYLDSVLWRAQFQKTAPFASLLLSGRWCRSMRLLLPLLLPPSLRLSIARPCMHACDFLLWRAWRW